MDKRIIKVMEFIKKNYMVRESDVESPVKIEGKALMVTFNTNMHFPYEKIAENPKLFLNVIHETGEFMKTQIDASKKQYEKFLNDLYK